MTDFAKALIWLKAITAWKDGDGVAFYWNWWHPLSWFLVPVFFFASIILEGYPKTIRTRAQLGLGISPYWKGREKQYY